MAWQHSQVIRFELLQRARDGVPMWGGSTALPRLAADVELLLALGSVETASEGAYALTAHGDRALAAMAPPARGMAE